MIEYIFQGDFHGKQIILSLQMKIADFPQLSCNLIG